MKEGLIQVNIYIILVSLTVMRIIYYFTPLKLSIVAGVKLEKYPNDVSVRGISTILKVYGSRRRQRLHTPCTKKFLVPCWKKRREIVNNN